MEANGPLKTAPNTPASLTALRSGVPAVPVGQAPSATVAADQLTLNGKNAAALPWVKAEGTQFKDANGNALRLMGVNLGGWMVQEPWMMPLAKDPPIKDQKQIWDTLEKRFGTAKMREIQTAWQDAQLSDADFVRMKEMGMNTVRLPFTYDELEAPGGFEKLDWAIEQAAKNGIYTLLDMHGAPGRQSKEMHTGQEGVNEFFKKPENVQKAADLWKKIAARYKDRPEVIGYDLLNEPMGARGAKELHAAHDVLYKAIREVDPKHIVMMEDGYKGLATLPAPQKYGWQNVAYSVHQYNFKGGDGDKHLDSLKSAIKGIERTEKALNVPVYLGEFNVPGASNAKLNAFIEMLGENHIDWAMWNYKAIFNHSGKGNSWAIYHNDGGAEVLNVYKDSPEELLRKIGTYKTEKLMAAPNTPETFRREAAAAKTRIEPQPSAMDVGVAKVKHFFVRLGMGVVDGFRSLFGI